MNAEAQLKRAREVIDIEIEAMQEVRAHLGEDFHALVKRCDATLSGGGKLIWSGIGKSGYIGRKIAATLSSVGSPSVFMHPVEALHGDLGIIQKHDLIVALSYSGETDELLRMLLPAKRLGVSIAAITASRNSRLGTMSDLVLEMPVGREACPFNLAPTSSTTALLAIGDALAMVLLDQRGFTKEDFGRLHPGGAIGRMVTMRCSDIMRGADRLAPVSPDATVKEALLAMSKARCGAAIIVDAERRPLGIFTDGDFRRTAEKDDNALTRVMRDVMTSKPSQIKESALAVEAVKMIEQRHINAIIVVDDAGKLAGTIDVQDMPGLKLM